NWDQLTSLRDNHVRNGPDVSKESSRSRRGHCVGRYPDIGYGIIKAACVVIAIGAVVSLAAPYEHFVPGPNSSRKVSLGRSIDQTGGRPGVGRGIVSAAGTGIEGGGCAAPDN